VGLAFDPQGNLYVSEYAENAIVKIDPESNVTVFATSGLNGPAYMALQPKLYPVDRSIVAGAGAPARAALGA
jgi:hypothetical protein